MVTVNLQDRIDKLTDDNDVNKNQIQILLKVRKSPLSPLFPLCLHYVFLTMSPLCLPHYLHCVLQELEEVQKELNIKSEETIYYKQECNNLQSLISKYAIPARDHEPVKTWTSFS